MGMLSTSTVTGHRAPVCTRDWGHGSTGSALHSPSALGRCEPSPGIPSQGNTSWPQRFPEDSLLLTKEMADPGAASWGWAGQSLLLGECPLGMSLAVACPCVLNHHQRMSQTLPRLPRPIRAVATCPSPAQPQQGASTALAAHRAQETWRRENPKPATQG